MRKIMFNDKYLLTQAVLSKEKTITRRTIPQSLLEKVKGYQKEYYENTLSSISVKDAIFNMAIFEGMCSTSYHIGQVIAIAQSYETMANGGYLDNMLVSPMEFKKEYTGAGYTNKMFVKGELMPHQIKIKNVRIERLQDISDEDCLKEGIRIDEDGRYYFNVLNKRMVKHTFTTPREAFISLINLVSGKNTWESNPWVFVYEFDLLK